jgi:hypothetical protein
MPQPSRIAPFTAAPPMFEIFDAPGPIEIVPTIDPITVTPFPAGTSRRAKAWRLMRETSKAAWYRASKNLPHAERTIFIGIAAFWYRRQYWPTSMELFEFLQQLRHRRYRWILDINNVRPRLTTLNQHRNRAGELVPMVITAGTRRCASRHAQRQRAVGSNPGKVLTWAIPQVGGRQRRAA